MVLYSCTSSFGVLHCGHVRNSCLQRKLNGAGVACEGRSPAVVPAVCSGPEGVACVAFDDFVCLFTKSIPECFS